MRVVDLTQPLDEGTVLWPGSQPFAVETVGEHDPDGYFARVFRTPEHSGTHLDAPAHFAPEGARVDAVPANRLAVPCAVIDVREQCAADPDFGLEAAGVEEAEQRDGPIGPGSAVLLRTGWEDRARDARAWLGGTELDDLHFPGFAASAAALLVERGAVGLGIDTVSVDRGCDAAYPVHNITLPAGLWHLEGLVNLGALPPRGALLVAGALPLTGGSGAPARVMALLDL